MMSILRTSILIAGCVWCCVPGRGADEEEQLLAEKLTANMVQRIDELVAERWQPAGVSPAVQAEDSEFLRRAYLDLIGVIPTAAEVRAFLADEAVDKRKRLILKLVQKPSHATHLAAQWSSMLLPAEQDPFSANNRVGFQLWLRDRFSRNVRYDITVADLLTTRGNPQQATAALFYTAAELKPEELAARSARVFLGVQIECAQCHDHPFDKWTMRDFWGYAAFFARIEQSTGRGDRITNIADRRDGEVKFPGTDDAVAPMYLGRIPASEENGTRRLQLAIWLASRDNPYFARATVNRAWAMMFGRGIVEPVDDLGPHNTPSHPELLDELARYFIKIRFDLRRLLVTLASTKTYALSSRWPADQAEPSPELFARMAMKSLTPEQLFDCLATLMRRSEFSTVNVGEFAVDSARQNFLSKFDRGATGVLDYQSGIPQALTMMNGQEISAATDLKESGLLIALQAPFLTPAQRIDSLFLSTLSRLPTPDESARFLAHLEAAPTSADAPRALGDLLWALLNCAEFTLNH